MISIMISGIDRLKRKLQLKRFQKSWMIATLLLLPTILPCFKKNRSTCTPSFKVKYLLMTARHLFGTMSMILTHKRYTKSSRLTIYNPPKPRWNHPSFCRILPLHGLAKAHGMVLPNHSLSTGRIRSVYTRKMFPLLIISQMARSESCYNMRLMV
jgi:hypothetical protein